MLGAPAAPSLIAAALCTLLVPTLVSASSSARKPKDYAAVALNVLPPGEAADSGPNSTDQLALYDALDAALERGQSVQRPPLLQA